MNQFLFGPGFDGICTDFGRPAVRTWHGIAVCDGPEHASVPVAATRTVEGIDPGRPLAELTSRLTDETATGRGSRASTARWSASTRPPG